MASTASPQELAGPSPVSFHTNPPRRIQGYGNPLWHALKQTLYAILFQDEDYLASVSDNIAPETKLFVGNHVWDSSADFYTINDASVVHVHAAIREMYDNDKESNPDYDSDSDSDSGAELSVTRRQRAGSEETIIDDQTFDNINTDSAYILSSARNLQGNHGVKRRSTDDTDSDFDFVPSIGRITSYSKDHVPKRRKLESAVNMDEEFNPEPRGVLLQTATPSPNPISRKEKKVRHSKKYSPNHLPHGKRLPSAAMDATVATAAVTRVKWEDHEGAAMFEALKTFQNRQRARGETFLKDMHLYNEITKLMGGGRSAGSCKNYWTRTGRSRFQWDEKKGEHSADVSPTCVQVKKEKKTKQGSSNN